MNAPPERTRPTFWTATYDVRLEGTQELHTTYLIAFSREEDADAFARAGLEAQPKGNALTYEVLTGLLGIIAEQQRQIEELRDDVQQLAKARVAVEAQDKIIALIQHLTDMGRDVAGPELTVKLSASVRSEDRSEASESGTDNRQNSGSLRVSGEIKGLLEVLGGLSGQLEKSKEEVLERVRAVESKELHRTDRSYDGELSIRFASIAGDPLVKARARAMGAPEEPDRSE